MSTDDQKPNKDDDKMTDSTNKNMEKAMFRVSDHLVIKDAETGKVIINKRG